MKKPVASTEGNGLLNTIGRYWPRLSKIELRLSWIELVCGPVLPRLLLGTNLLITS